MKYTIDDIPYLVGLHFRLSDDAKSVWTYHIHSYRFEDVYIDWPHRNDRFSPMSRYPTDVFLENLNNGTWIITDLPSSELFDKLYESEENIDLPKAGDVLIAKEDLLYHSGKLRFVTKDKEYPITEVEWGGPGNDGYIIMDDNRSRHTLSLGFIHKHFNIIDHTVNMDYIINQLYESKDINPLPMVGDFVRIVNPSYFRAPVKKGEIFTIIEVDKDHPLYGEVFKTGMSIDGSISLYQSTWSLKNWSHFFELIPKDSLDIDSVFNELNESKTDDFNITNIVIYFGRGRTHNDIEKVTDIFNSYITDENSKWVSEDIDIVLEDYKNHNLYLWLVNSDSTIKWGSYPPEDPNKKIISIRDFIESTDIDTQSMFDQLNESKTDKNLDNYRPPVGSYLTCHRDGYMVDEDGDPTGERFATEGKEYKISGYVLRSGEDCKEALYIIDDFNHQHLFGVTGCNDGPAYLKWFYPSVTSLPSHEEIWKTMNEQEDDLGWAKEISQNLDYWKLLKTGQTVIIKPHHNPIQQKYFKATLKKCRFVDKTKPSDYYGTTIKINDDYDPMMFERHDVDCFTCRDFSLDCEGIVTAIEVLGFWLSSDMVDIEILS